MSRTYDNEKKPSQSTFSWKPTDSFLQTRGFAPIQTDLDEDATPRPSGYTENFLEKIINQRGTSGTSDTPVQPKRMNRLQTLQAKRMSMIQAKLSIGEPNDKYEQEADATASRVVQQINSPTQDQSVQREEEKLQKKSLVQRSENLGGGEASTDLESSIQSARGSGQPLDARLQKKMGQAMRADFSGVKIHTDSQSDQLNESIQARAFTTGQDLFFRQGAYDPSSRGGQELIAHELTHVVQQNGNNVQAKHDTSTIQRVSVKERIEFFESLGVKNDSKGGIPLGAKDISPDTAPAQDKDTQEFSPDSGVPDSNSGVPDSGSLDSIIYSDGEAAPAQDKDTQEFSPDSGVPDSNSGVPDSGSPDSIVFSDEEDEYDNYEAPKKYGKVNKRAEHYEGEDKDSRDITHVNDIFESLETAVAQNKLPSVAVGLKKMFGWSDEDVAKYYDNKEKSKVEYLDEESRKDYELVGGSTLMQGEPPTPFDTSKMFSKHSGNGFAIYVMSPNGELYSHAHKVGLFHHSSFLAGLPTAGAGEIKVIGGTVQHITNKSGHYQPDDQNMIQTLQEFKSRGVNLAGVKLAMVDGRNFDSAQQFLDDKGV